MENPGPYVDVRITVFRKEAGTVGWWGGEGGREETTDKTTLKLKTISVSTHTTQTYMCTTA